MSLDPTPIVRIRLGGEWETESRKYQVGDVAQVDAVRGAWLLDHIPGSQPASRASAEKLGAPFPGDDPEEDDPPVGAVMDEEVRDEEPVSEFLESEAEPIDLDAEEEEDD